MLGKWSVIALLIAAGASTGCRRTPTADQVMVSPFPVALAVTVGTSCDGAVLTNAIDSYDREPTSDHAVDVWTAFARVNTRLAELKGEVSRLSGGAKAEAEIERIELQRLRDEQMERFANTQARFRQARVAFDNLAASIDRREGVRAAASVIARGLGGETSESKHSLRGLSSQVRLR